MYSMEIKTTCCGIVTQFEYVFSVFCAIEGSRSSAEHILTVILTALRRFRPAGNFSTCISGSPVHGDHYMHFIDREIVASKDYQVVCRAGRIYI